MYVPRTGPGKGLSFANAKEAARYRRAAARGVPVRLGKGGITEMRLPKGRGGGRSAFRSPSKSELLRRSHRAGALKTDRFGRPWVRIGRDDMVEEADPRVTPTAIAALVRSVRKGRWRHQKFVDDAGIITIAIHGFARKGSIDGEWQVMSTKTWYNWLENAASVADIDKAFGAGVAWSGEFAWASVSPPGSWAARMDPAGPFWKQS